MYALVLSGKGFENLQLRRVQVPRPGKSQFLARVDAVFACASDGKLIESASDHPFLYGWDTGRWPISIGHEGCITAVEVGENLRGKFRAGQAFCLQPAIHCGPINHRERYQNPDSIDNIAIGYTLGGLFAEYILITEEVIETESLIPYDTSKVPYFAAAFSEPLSCVYSSQNQVSHIYKKGPMYPREVRLGLKERGVVLILGAGPMGILHAELAMIHRPRAVIISEPLEKRRRQAQEIIKSKAEKWGVVFVVTNPHEVARMLKGITGGRGADDCISALGIAKVQEESISYLGRGGVAVFFGGMKAGESLIAVDTRRIHYDGVSIVGSSGGDPSDIQVVMRLIERGEVSLEMYVKRVGGLEAALDLVRSVKVQEFFGKGLIYPQVSHPLFPVDSWSFAKEKEFLEKNLR
jgi:threonine dehydrogenase-like Zn-dependent dehydrogenase